MRREKHAATGTIPYEVRIRRNRARRNRELKRHLTAGILTLTAFLFVLVFGLNTTMSDAREAGEATVYKYYRSVAVLPHDTVEGFAAAVTTGCTDTGMTDAGIDVCALSDEIRSINHLTDGEEPLAGTMMIVPYFSTEFSD
ncbi:MAG: hypothetical protein K6G16_01660 [Lachnospiraceae bacterium]|nr:hypothetical protein [Lachnospiraceae bacterium]